MSETIQLIGHSDIKHRLEIAIKAAHFRNKALPHILLTGAAGCGKTTTAAWISKLGNYDFMSLSPTSLKTSIDVHNLLNKMNYTGYNEVGDRIGKIKPTILFFDEIHQLSVIGQEVLGIAMENYHIEVGEVNKVMWVPYFTVIGATTDDGKLTKPFRDRFKMVFLYESYDDETMSEILKYHVAKNNLEITDTAIINIVNRSKGTPRLMVNYLDSIRDYLLYINDDTDNLISNDVCDTVFEALNVDAHGLTATEVKILKTLYKIKIPIGIENLAITTNESVKTIQNTIEPFLIKKGLVVRIAKGRAITEKGIKYLEQEGHLKSVMSNKVTIASDYVRR